jgi:hypothetical protein
LISFDYRPLILRRIAVDDDDLEFPPLEERLLDEISQALIYVLKGVIQRYYR